MAVSLRRAVSVGISVALMVFVSMEAAANPLCASPEQRQTVQSALTESPKSSLAEIASAIGIPEVAVVHAMSMETRHALRDQTQA